MIFFKYFDKIVMILLEYQASALDRCHEICYNTIYYIANSQ